MPAPIPVSAAPRHRDSDRVPWTPTIQGSPPKVQRDLDPCTAARGVVSGRRPDPDHRCGVPRPGPARGCRALPPAPVPSTGAACPRLGDGHGCRALPLSRSRPRVRRAPPRARPRVRRAFPLPRSRPRVRRATASGETTCHQPRRAPDGVPTRADRRTAYPAGGRPASRARTRPAIGEPVRRRRWNAAGAGRSGATSATASRNDEGPATRGPRTVGGTGVNARPGGAVPPLVVSTVVSNQVVRGHRGLAGVVGEGGHQMDTTGPLRAKMGARTSVGLIDRR